MQFFQSNSCVWGQKWNTSPWCKWVFLTWWRSIAALNLPWGNGACSRAESSPQIWWELGCTGQVAGNETVKSRKSDLVHTEPAPGTNHQVKLQSCCRIKQQNVFQNISEQLVFLKKKMMAIPNPCCCIYQICSQCRQTLFLLGEILH